MVKMSRFAKHIQSKNFLQLIFVLMFIFQFTGCWIFSGQALIKKNEITGNTLPASENEITQEVISMPEYEFGHPFFEDQKLEAGVIIKTRRQYFGDISVDIKNSKIAPQVKTVYWENYVNNTLFSKGKGGWIESNTSLEGFNSTAIFKNIKLKNQINNHIKLYFDAQRFNRLIGEVIVFADFEYPKIEITKPANISFINQNASSTVWFNDFRGELAGIASDNIELKTFGYRILDTLSDEDEIYTTINLDNSNWNLEINLTDEEKLIEFLAEDVFGNKTYRRIKVGLDNEGPELIFLNPSGVKEGINIRQGNQEWQMMDVPTLDSPFKIKSVSDEEIVINGRVYDLASGAKNISIKVCYYTKDCSDPLNYDLFDSINATEDFYIDQWEFRVNGSYDRNSNTSIKSGVNFIKLVSVDDSGNSSEVDLIFIIDNQPPQIDLIKFHAIGDESKIFDSTEDRSIAVKVHATDLETKIEKVCLKLDADLPGIINPCWREVDNPDSQISQSFNLNLGFFPKQYDVYIWAIDEVGNISSTISSTIFFTPTNHPHLLEVFAGNTTKLTYWPTVGEMTTSNFSEDNNILVKWRVPEAENPSISHVNLSYRLEDSTKEVVPIAQNVFHGINPGGCTVEPPFQGCYVWKGNNIPKAGVKFSIHVDVVNLSGQVDGGSTNYFNSGLRDFTLFGNTKLGTHHLAVSDVFQTYGFPNFSKDNLIVLADGSIFFVDEYRGLLRIDANTGFSTIIISDNGSDDKSDNDWVINGKINKIKIDNSYIYFRYIDLLAGEKTGRVKIINLNNGELSEFEAEFSLPVSSNEFWKNEVPPIAHPTSDTNCNYKLGANNFFYCYDDDLGAFYKLVNSNWETIIKGDSNTGCPDGTSHDACNDLVVTTFYVDQLGVVYFTDGYRIRYLSPSKKIYTIYGSLPDSELSSYGEQENLKAGRLVRIPKSEGTIFNIDWINSKINVNAFNSTQFIGNCSNLPCNQFSVSDEGFQYSSIERNGFIEVFKTNNDLPPEKPILTTTDGVESDGRFVVKNRTVHLNISSNDNNSNIEKICLKYNIDPNIVISLNDSCWKSIDNNDQTSLVLNNYIFNLGFVAGFYNLYAWVMDEDKRISSPSDLLAFSYVPGKPPEVRSVLATNKNIPTGAPPNYIDLVINNSNRSLFIKWIATDFDDISLNEKITGLTANLYYSLDNLNFIPIAIAQNLPIDISSSNCTTNLPDEVLPNGINWTGCFEWLVPSFLQGKMLFVRVEVIDEDSLGASALAPPINAGNLSIIAGDIDKGIGGQARSAMFSLPANDNSDRGGWSFPNSFVINSQGITYFLDIELGILMVDPSDGIIQLLIGINENEIIPSINEGPKQLRNSKLKNPISIFLTFDEDENLLVYDKNYIRKIDVKNKEIKTIIGGGGGNGTSRKFNPENCDNLEVFANGLNYYLNFFGLSKESIPGWSVIVIGVDNNRSVPPIGEEVDVASAKLVNPKSMYAMGNLIYILDDGFLRLYDTVTNKIKTLRTANTKINCGYSYDASHFNFEFLNNLSRPNLHTNLRTIIPLPRGDLLIDYHGISQKREGNWNSYFDDNVPGSYDVFPSVSTGRSAEVRSGLWWYRPVNFNDLAGEWGIYPIKFTDGNKDCVNNGFTASFEADPTSNDYGKIKRIFAILLNECQIDDSDSQSRQMILEFDPSPLYTQEIIPSPLNEAGASILPWPRLKATNTPPFFGNNGVNPHYNATSVGRDGIPLIYNRAVGGAYTFNNNPDLSRVVSRVLGNGIGTSCFDGKLPLEDDCKIEILDMFKTADGTIYFWDLSQIKSISEGKIITVFGKPANHGNNYLSTSARFSFISDFGFFGRDSEGAPNSKNMMIMDIYSRTFRSVIDGKIENHFGSGHYGLNSDSTYDLNPFTKNHRIYFDWGDDNYYVRKSFEVDADGNIYYVNRTNLQLGDWSFENNKISFNEFYPDGSSGADTSVRKISPITHQNDLSLPITSYNKYQVGNIIGRATYLQDQSSVKISNRIGHVFGINQKDNNLLLHMNSKREEVAGVMYVMDLNDTINSLYDLNGKTNLFKNRNFELPKIKDILTKYENSSLPFCHGSNNLPLNECKISSLEGSDHGYSFYENELGEKYWVSWLGNSIFSMEEKDGDPFGQIKLLHQTSNAYIKSLDIDQINGETILAYCYDGHIKILNLETRIETEKEIKIKGMECSKGGIEIIYNQKTNKFALVSAVTYHGLHAIVEIALPSSPKVTNVRTESGSNILTNKKFFMRISGKDPKEPLSQYCVKFNDNSSPNVNDSCWKDINLSNITEVNNYLVEVEVGQIAGDYEIFVWLKDIDDEISGISNNQEGTEGIDKIKVTYDPQNLTIIDNLVVSTSSSAQTINFDNSRDSRDSIDRYYISWNLRNVESEISANLDITFNGIDFYSIKKGVDAYVDGCANGFSGCFTWTDVFNFIAAFIPVYQQDKPFQIRLTLFKSDGRKFSMISSPIGANALPIIGENYHGIGSSWEDFSFPLINQVYDQNLQSNHLLMQQFIVTKRGDILFNHPTDGLMLLDIELGLTKLAIQKRFDSLDGSNGNGNRWALAKVDNVSKITIDQNDVVYLADKNEIRKFAISEISSSINTFQPYLDPGTENAYELNKIKSPFNISDGFGYFHQSPLKIGADSNDFSFTYLSKNLNNESVVSIVKFTDFKNSIQTEYPLPIGSKQEFTLINDDNCGSQLEKVEIDINSCSIKNYFSTGVNQSGGSDFYFIAECGCTDPSSNPNTSTGIFHLQPFWNPDSGNLEFSSQIAKVDKFIGQLSKEVASNGYYFNGLDKKLYLIYRGEISDTGDQFELNPENLNTNAGIWKFNAGSGWVRILGVENEMGTCNEGDHALSCAASPRDMFVSQKGFVYFLENTHLKRIDENGKIRFVTGRGKKEGPTTSPLVYRANAFKDLLEDSGAIKFYEPVLDKIISATGDVVTLVDNTGYTPLVISNTYHCNEVGFICRSDDATSGCIQELDAQGNLVDVIVFPRESDYLYRADPVKLEETNHNIYLNDWKCFGQNVFVKNGKYFVPYFHRSSSGVMQVFLD